MSSRSRRTGGRIFPHQRETNDGAGILGNDLVGAIGGELHEAVQETIALGMNPKTRMDYRRRISKIIKFFRESVPDYYGVGVRQLEDDEIAETSRYMFGQKEDLIYTGINAQFLIVFLSSTDKRADGKLKSFEDMRKYRDSVLWGAKVAGERMPTLFYESMDTYLGAYKKKFASAKKQGNVDAFSTDPIPIAVYRLLLQSSVETNNIFSWLWTLLQWNCMARSASIDCLCFHNFSLGQDSIIVKYDETKADKAGEKLSEKNVYANPMDWTMCSWLAFGIYCSLFSGILSESERLFLRKGTKEGTASCKYHEQILGLVKGNEPAIMTHMKVERLNPYGLRKGAATHAVSGTTAAPSIPSIARRGEWSIGSVLDVYWHFGSVGDHYLGRILCGLDPTHSSFATLPPHWIIPDPLGNEFVHEAMVLMYGDIMQAYDGKPENPIGILVRSLACIVYHSEHLLEIVVRHPGHDFSKLTLLQNRPLLSELKELVSISPTVGVMTTATGIPPHISLSIQIGKILDTVAILVGQFGQHGENLTAVVEQALNTRAWESGHVTGSRLKEILEEYKKESISAMDGQLQSIRQQIQLAIRSNRLHEDQDDENEERGGESGGGGGSKVKLTYSYDGRFYAVPQGYEFPKVNLKDGLRIWLKEQVISTNGMDRIKPLRKISLSMLPKRLAQQVRMNFLPIFKFLEPVLLNLPKQDGDITEELLQKTYDDCISFLQSRVSYLFVKGRSNPTQYSLGTWSNKTSFSAISKDGTEEDKAAMSEANRRNLQRQPKTRKRNLSTRPKYPNRQGRNRRLRGSDEHGRTTTTTTTGTSFATAFEDVGEMTEAMRRREEEIRLEVEADDRDARRTEEVRRIREEGWTSRPIPLVRNYGDMSGFDRTQIGQQINRIFPEGNPVRGVGHCCISGCVHPEMQLLHRCSKCKQFIHMVCAEPFNNLAEDERYCDQCIPGR